MDADQFRKAAHAAIEEIIAYNENITQYHVLPTVKPGFLAPQLPTTAPDSPESWSDIQPDIAAKIIPGLTHWQSPNFLAFFPAGVTYPSLLGEMYSAAFNAPAFNWLCSPACTELETVVLDWLAKALALPPAFLSTSATGGGGVIQGSASEAVVTCMVVARERYLNLRADAEGLAPNSPERNDRITFLRGRLVALSSDQAHSSTQKGATIAGTHYKPIKTTYATDLSLTGAELAAALAECAAEGLEPYYLTTTLGTTSTCAVDDFASLAAVRATHAPKMWVHVDAAYAGSALICPEYQHLSSLLEGPHAFANSFDFNLHKWLLVNFDASCLFVRDRNDLTRTLTVTPAYLQNKHTDSGLVTDYRDWQIPLGRRFRALKIWFVMRSYGLEGMRAHVRKTISIGETFAGLIKGDARGKRLFEMVAGPSFGLTCWRVRPEVVAGAAVRAHPAAPGRDAEAAANKVTKQIADLVNEQGEIFLTATSAGGKSMMRVIAGNPRQEEGSVRKAFEIVVKVTAELLGLNDDPHGDNDGEKAHGEVFVNGHGAAASATANGVVNGVKEEEW